MTGNQDKRKVVPRSVVAVALLIVMLCLAVMARYVDTEIKRANQAVQDAESRSADTIIKLIKVQNMYMKKLEALRTCEHGN